MSLTQIRPRNPEDWKLEIFNILIFVKDEVVHHVHGHLLEDASKHTA